MSVSYKAIVNFKTKQIRLKEYTEPMLREKLIKNVWDIQFHTLDDEWYGLDHVDIHTNLDENTYSVNVYHIDHSKTAFNVELKIRTKKFKNWNEYVHPDIQKKMDDTTEILEEATRIVRERAMLRESEAMLKAAKENFNARQRERGVSV